MTSRTELVFILDRSGSMGGLENDTIGGFNSMLHKQQAAQGECRLTTVLFDHHYELLHDRIEIKAVSPIDSSQYFVRGNTALLDAVGQTINKIRIAQQNTAPEYRAEKVIIVITTDGMENASSEYSAAQIREMISRQKEQGWEFVFLGANMDAVGVAATMGIPATRSATFINDAEGIKLNYQALSDSVASYRAAPAEARLDDSWSEAITEDLRKRSKEPSKK